MSALNWQHLRKCSWKQKKFLEIRYFFHETRNISIKVLWKQIAEPDNFHETKYFFDLSFGERYCVSFIYLAFIKCFCVFFLQFFCENLTYFCEVFVTPDDEVLAVLCKHSPIMFKYTFISVYHVYFLVRCLCKCMQLIVYLWLFKRTKL